jgi:hypothetical protein
LSASFRSESSSPGRVISYPWRETVRGCIIQGRKPQRGRRIVLKIYHIIIQIEHAGLTTAGTPKKMVQRGKYAWFNPLGAEQPWQGDSFSGCGIFR